MTNSKIAAALAASVCIVAMATPAQAQTREYRIPAGSLKSALDSYARQSGRQVIYKVDDIRNARSAGAQGSLSADAALNSLLRGSGFTFRADSSGAIAIIPGEAGAGSTAADDESAGSEEIIVTGSRIRGATPTSPVVTVTQDQMRNSGMPTLGDVARSLPQSFGGGQNPGVTVGVDAGNTNVNTTGTSSINLRGLGSDATLTLLNGHRLAYDSAYQGVDIAGIPVAAVSRLEVVADGASAIYGSDAVGGVANIILKRDFEGMETTAQFGAATQGGNELQQYSAVGGHKWSSGGVMVVYNYQENTPIVSRQRSYTEASQDDQTLLPGLKQHSVVLFGHQRLSDNVTFVTDATFNSRTSETFNATSATVPAKVTGQWITGDARSYSITPSLEWTISPAWSATLSGTYARSDSKTVSTIFSNSVLSTQTPARYDNTTRTVELSGEGSPFQLNGNPVRVAVGAGYRSNHLDQSIGGPKAPSGTRTSFSSSDNSYYGFGEVSFPLVSPDNKSGIYRLELNAAARYEHYNTAGEVVTPKIGGVFAPIEDIAFKASWGRSFKAPTLTQRYDIPNAYLFNASFFGIPRAGTAVMLTGANPGLKPERATTWSATMELKPRFAPGFHFEASYFNINYTDRVVIGPIAQINQAYGNPSYVGLITYDPSLALINSSIAIAPAGLRNNTGAPFNPSTVVAILDNRQVNIARQRLHGVDLLASYDFESAALGKFSIAGNASYLRSRQVLLPGQAEVELAGTVYDPPKWRGRGSITWSKGNVTLFGAMNYSGPLIDDRRSGRVEIPSLSTFDFTARVRTTSESGALANVDISLSALNFFNANPRIIRTFNVPQARPYDSTNDSVIGRFVSLSVTKRW